MNRVLDAIVGGWSLNSILPLQSGQPIPFGLANASIADGTQRPDILCSKQLTGMSLHDLAFSTDPSASYYNSNCFSSTTPGDQVPGTLRVFPPTREGKGSRILIWGSSRILRCGKG